MTARPEDRSTTGLVSDLVDQTTTLFRKEVQLLRAEASEKTSQAFAAIGLIAGGLVLALTAINVLAAALVAGLTELGIEGGWAALIVGAVLAVIGYALVSSGINNLKASNLTPNRTVSSVQKDIEVARESVQ